MYGTFVSSLPDGMRVQGRDKMFGPNEKCTVHLYRPYLMESEFRGGIKCLDLTKSVRYILYRPYLMG